MEGLTSLQNELESVLVGETTDGLKVYAVKREFRFGAERDQGWTHYWTGIVETPSKRHTMAYHSRRFYGSSKDAYDRDACVKKLQKLLEMDRVIELCPATQTPRSN